MRSPERAAGRWVKKPHAALRSLQSLVGAERTVIMELDARLTEVYRQLLLAVINELWVEYLTQMRRLGCRLFGGLCPARLLVQIKPASGLFQTC
jgi:hypothetical protein